jgi:hypothetical protein
LLELSAVALSADGIMQAMLRRSKEQRKFIFEVIGGLSLSPDC